MFLTLTLHEKISDRRRLVIVPLAVAATAIVPTLLLGSIWGSGTSGFSAEAFLFCVLFALAAAVFALGYELICDRLF